MDQRPQPSQRAGFGLLITNLARLAAVMIGVNESLLRTEARPVALGVAALFFAGAQAVDTALEKLLKR